MIEGVLFDLDGTLADTLQDITDGVNAGLATIGLRSRTPQDLRPLVGNGLRNLLLRLVPASSHPKLPAVQRLVTAYYADHAAEKSVPYPGIPATLDGLRERSVRCAILSNKPHQVAELLVERLFGAWEFDAIWGFVDEASRKPHPGGALALASRMGVAPERLVVVGDSEVDVRTAKNAGMQAAAVTWGFRDRVALEGEDPDWILEHPSELLDLVDGARRGRR